MVRAQYAAGTLDGKTVPAYKNEPDVSPSSGPPKGPGAQRATSSQPAAAPRTGGEREDQPTRIIRPPAGGA